MKIFVGVKNSDLEALSCVFGKRVSFISWPDDNKMQSTVIFSTMKKFASHDVCYIHFSGYKRLTNAELKIFQNRCINIHPAPPKYPGVGGLNHALYNNENCFGVTVHLMNTLIDDGKILDVVPFFIGKYKCLQKAICDLSALRLQILEGIIEDILQSSFDEYLDKHNHKKFSWSDKMWSRKELNAMQTVLINDSNDGHELEKRVRAFQTDAFPVQLQIKKTTIFTC